MLGRMILSILELAIRLEDASRKRGRALATGI
jgi:hypothetical protein